MVKDKPVGWRKESARHALARKGIKTGTKIPISSVKEQTHTTYTSPEGFEFTFEPVEGTITVKKTKDGYEARYITRDMDAESPDSYGDDNLFLVNYHRDFDVRNDNIITEDDVRNLYQGEKISQEKDYWIFPVEAYIHSGVSLKLSPSNWQLPQGHEQFDVSHVGLVLVSKKEFKSKKKAEKSAEGLVETWNMYLGNDVYGIIKETYTKEKGAGDQDSVWGFYGYKHALSAVKTDI